MAQSTSQSRSNPPHKSYKHIAVIFVIMAFLLVLGVTYLALSKATITLTPSNQPVKYDFSLTVSQNPTNNTSTSVIIPGKVFSETKEITGQFYVTSGKTVDASAQGFVTLYNDRPTPQTLVATTRLLTPKNILFRLKDKVTIPAKSQLEAEVYADQKGISGNIEPSSFIIPGLSEDLQKVVYAKSNKTMTGGTRQIGILTTEDIEKAKEKLIQDNSSDILTKFINNLDGQSLTLLDTTSKVTNINNDQALGEEVDSFTLSGTLTISAVFADENEALTMAKTKLKESQGPKGEFINADPSSINYTISSINTDKGEAILKTEISGISILDPNKNIFNKDLLVGFTEEDLQLYFSQFESIKDIQVSFTPFWVKKVPILKDHIIIEIAK